MHKKSGRGEIVFHKIVHQFFSKTNGTEAELDVLSVAAQTEGSFVCLSHQLHLAQSVWSVCFSVIFDLLPNS